MWFDKTNVKRSVEGKSSVVPERMQEGVEIITAGVLEEAKNTRERK